MLDVSDEIHMQLDTNFISIIDVQWQGMDAVVHLFPEPRVVNLLTQVARRYECNFVGVDNSCVKLRCDSQVEIYHSACRVPPASIGITRGKSCLAIVKMKVPRPCAFPVPLRLVSVLLCDEDH